eukprot:2855043-Pyramimonas_sp.AAC.1
MGKDWSCELRTWPPSSHPSRLRFFSNESMPSRASFADASCACLRRRSCAPCPPSIKLVSE